MYRTTILVLVTGFFLIFCKKPDSTSSCGRLLAHLTPSLDQMKVKTKLHAKDGECSLLLRNVEPATDKAISSYLLANGWAVERTESGKNETFTAYANDAAGGCSVTGKGAGDCTAATCYSEFKIICYPRQ